MLINGIQGCGQKLLTTQHGMDFKKDMNSVQKLTTEGNQAINNKFKLLTQEWKYQKTKLYWIKSWHKIRNWTMKKKKLIWKCIQGRKCKYMGSINRMRWNNSPVSQFLLLSVAGWLDFWYCLNIISSLPVRFYSSPQFEHSLLCQ